MSRITVRQTQDSRNLLHVLYLVKGEETSETIAVHKFTINMDDSFVVKVMKTQTKEIYKLDVYTKERVVSIMDSEQPIEEFLIKISQKLQDYYIDNPGNVRNELSFFYMEQVAVVYSNVALGMVAFLRCDEVVSLTPSTIVTVDFKVEWLPRLPSNLHKELVIGMTRDFNNPPVNFEGQSF